jgi:hypothetical protein
VIDAQPTRLLPCAAYGSAPPEHFLESSRVVANSEVIYELIMHEYISSLNSTSTKWGPQWTDRGGFQRLNM